MPIAVVSTSSGAGKTTLGRRLARFHAVPFVELDSLHHLPGWRPNPLFRFALSTYRRRRREMPARLDGCTVVHLRSQREVDDWLAEVEAADTLTP